VRKALVVVTALLVGACRGSGIEGRWIGSFFGDPVVLSFASEGVFEMPSLGRGLYAVRGDTVVVTLSAASGQRGLSSVFLLAGDSLVALDRNLGLETLRRAR